MNKLLAVLFLACVSLAAPAQADWGFDVGYNNPPGANLGINFINFWQNVALEFGAGYINSSNSGGTSTTVISGDINLKYLFLADEVVRPYIQGGFGLGSATSIGNNGGVYLGAGGGFAGGGLYIKGRSLFAYGSYNVASSSNFWQAGLGFMF